MKTTRAAAVLALAAFSFYAIAGDKYQVDTKASKLEWLAKKVTGQHNGTVDIKSGSLEFEGDQLTGGSFVIDMPSIKVLDIENPEYNKKLVNHLNNEDFFNTGKHGEAKLKIKSAKNTGGSYEITADLTIKGITKPITFTAEVNRKASEVSASAKIVFDRSEYDVRYGSKSFFDNLGDKVIYDDVEMTVNLIAK